MKHTKEYRGLPNGSGQILCSCGWESPSIDESMAFTLGRKQKSVDSYFADHLIEVGRAAGVETAMVDPAVEQAVTAAQRPQAKKSKRQ